MARHLPFRFPLSEFKNNPKTFTLILFIIFSTLLLSQSCVQIKQIIPETSKEQVSVKLLEPDPNLVTGQLENGFRYVLFENHEPKDRVSLHLNVQVGSIHEEDNEQGIAHYLEHMLYNGSTHFDKGKLITYFQSIGMHFGADANAHTGFYETVYDMLLPDGSEKHLKESLIVMDDFARGALLLESEVEKEKNIVLAEKRTRDSASYRTFVKSIEFSLPETKLAQRLPIGTEETITKANKKQLKDFYDAWYRPEKMILVAVGNFNPEILKNLIEKQFQNLEPRAPPRKEPVFGKIRHKGTKVFYHYEEEEGKTNITIERVKKTPKQKDSLVFRKTLLTDQIANQMVQNRLNQMLGKQDTPFTEASIGSGIYLHHVNYTEISASCNPKNWQKTLENLEKTLRGCVTHGFLESELERVKKDMVSILENAVRSASTRNSNTLARQIIRSLNDERVFLSPEQEKNLFSDFIMGLTIKDVNGAIKNLWKEDHRLILVTGNAQIETSGKPAEEIILAVYENSNKIPVTAALDKGKIKFPYLPIPEQKGTIINRKDMDDIGITTIDFENGVRLNMKKTDFKANEVLFCVSFGNGRSDEPEHAPGLSIIGEETLNESGFGSLDKNQIEQALSGKSISFTFSVTDEHFAFMGNTITRDIETLFQLLQAQITDVIFREDAFTLAQERYKQKYDALERSIDGAVALYGESFLAGGDSRFGLPPYETFKNLSLADIENWIGSSIKNDPLEISIVGDFDPEVIIETTSKYIASLPERTATDARRDISPLKFPQSGELNISVKTEVPKGLVMVSYLTDEFWYINRTRRLSALGAVFSERLRKEIREKMGAAYSTFAYNKSSEVFPHYGVFRAIAQINPDQADMVINEIERIASEISKNGVTPEELKLSIAPILTSIKDMQRTNHYWLNSVLIGSKKFPQQLEWCRTIMDDYASIEAREINNLAKIYFEADKAAVIKIIPEIKEKGKE